MKSKDIIRILCVPVCFWAMIACQEEKLTEYQNDPRLSFGEKQESVVVQSFFVLNSKIGRDTVFLQVETAGYPENYDRPFAIAQSNAGGMDAAVAGVHYLAFTDPEIQDKLFIPAGKVNALVPVIVFRDKSLQQEIFLLRVDILENEYFKPGLLNRTTCTVRISDKADKPLLWDSFWETWLGEWSSVKMKFIIDYVGLTDFSNKSSAAEAIYYRTKANEQLKIYNEAHPEAPLCTDHNAALTQCDNCITFPK